jgi:opacity protein-like surface antigen
LGSAGGVKASLLAGVSSLALIVAGPGTATAAELPPRPALISKAPPAIQNKWTWWVEGGAGHLGGDPGLAGLNNPPFDVTAKSWGWEAAAGFDYRFDSVWHLSGQFRYGRNKAGSRSNNPIAVFNVFGTTPTTAFFPVTRQGSNAAEREESHWLADFMVGRDLGLGGGLPSTVRFGVRVAQIRGKTTGSAQWNDIPTSVTFSATCAASPTPAVCVSHTRSYRQDNNFFGAGPRLELDGSVPLAPRWSLDYMGGVAALYGRRTAVQKVDINQSTGTYYTLTPALRPNCATGCPVDAAFSDNAWVFNLDAMLGLSYAITPNVKATLNYRFDGYWNALKGFDSSGQVTNLNRFYQSALLRLSVSDGDASEAGAAFAAAPAAGNNLTWWVEGGAAHLGSSNSGVPGFTSPFDVSAQPWGWEAAAGFAYRLGQSWQVSGQFRYGRNGSSSRSSSPNAIFNIFSTIPTFVPLPFDGSNTAERKESRWLADFMVGRDLGLGQGLPATARFGVRVAEIRGKTTGAAQWNNLPTTITFLTTCATAPTPAVCITQRRDYTQENSFFGAGPRLELDGSVPLAPRWSLDYMGGVAALYGRRTAIQKVDVSQSQQTYFTTPLPVPLRPHCLSGCPVDASVSDDAWVFNADAMLGLSYAINDNLKATVSYRFDGYWNALKGFDANGQPTNFNRFYQGAMLRLTMAH